MRGRPRGTFPEGSRISRRGVVPLLACLVVAAAPAARSEPPVVGKVVHTETPVHKMPLSYYVPASAAARDRVPLVISYHGKGGNDRGEIGAWTGLAEKHGFVVACPKSYFAGADRPAEDKRELGPLRELEDAVAVVEMLAKHRGIDERFVMATGFSGGGLPSYTAGLLRPDIFRYVCSRCGNFPQQLVVVVGQHASTKPELARAMDSAVKSGHFYFFYGEKDHPVILQIDAPRQIQYFEFVKATHFKKQMIPGMGHDSRPDLAADWFLGEIAAAANEPATQKKPKGPKKTP